MSLYKLPAHDGLRPQLENSADMGANRKLQAEIDRTLEKVNEGIEVFDQIWEKVTCGAAADRVLAQHVPSGPTLYCLKAAVDQTGAWPVLT